MNNSSELLNRRRHRTVQFGANGECLTRRRYWCLWIFHANLTSFTSLKLPPSAAPMYMYMIAHRQQDTWYIDEVLNLNCSQNLSLLGLKITEAYFSSIIKTIPLIDFIFGVCITQAFRIISGLKIDRKEEKTKASDTETWSCDAETVKLMLLFIRYSSFSE